MPSVGSGVTSASGTATPFDGKNTGNLVTSGDIRQESFGQDLATQGSHVALGPPTTLVLNLIQVLAPAVREQGPLCLGWDLGVGVEWDYMLGLVKTCGDI